MAQNSTDPAYRHSRGIKREMIPCEICQTKVQVPVDEEDPPQHRIRILCHTCKTERTEYQTIFDGFGWGPSFKDQKKGELLGFRHLKPGDPDFERVAAECTHISQIRTFSQTSKDIYSPTVDGLFYGRTART